MTLGLLAVTWRLWVPQHVFPQVPLVTGADAMPWLLQTGSLALAVLGLLVALLDRREGRYWRAGLVAFAGSMLMLWVFDQHRLQPWAYQAFFMALVLAGSESGRGIALLRVFTVSIYFFSAVSKLDYTFLHSLGPQFTATLLQQIGATSDGWTDTQQLGAALLFPLGEFAVAVLLSVRRSRRFGLVAATFMHGLLLLVLGPLGMKQQPAVLVWNAEFIVLVWLLFGGRAKPSSDEHSADEAYRLTWPAVVVEGLLWIAIAAPLLEPFGGCDHWLAWGLYSPGASRAQVFVRASDVDHLPDDWRSYIAEGEETVTWRRVQIDRWSLERLRVPVYPQARFQLGVALAIANALPPGHDVRVELFSAANRFTGVRQQSSLQSRPQLDAAVRRYWINAWPER